MKRSIFSQLELSDERLTQLQDQLEQKSKQARNRTEEVVEDLQHRSTKVAGRLRDTSVTTGCELGANTLSKAAELLDEVPGMKKSADGLRQQAECLEETGKAVERPPIDDYNELNVSEVNDQLDDLSVYQLEKVRRYEADNKDRVTILREIDRLLS